MIRHTALFTFRDGVRPEVAAEFHRAVVHALDGIPHISAWAAGPALRIQEGGCDYALYLDFAGVPDFEAYKRHPSHRRLIDEQISQVVASTSRIQIEI